MIMWSDPEKRREKKLYRIGKNAAYAIGIGFGAWLLKYLYPRPEQADWVAGMFGPLGWLLIVYGGIMLALLAFKKNLAPAANFLFIAFVIPAGLFYIVGDAWSRRAQERPAIESEQLHDQSP